MSGEGTRDEAIVRRQEVNHSKVRENRVRRAARRQGLAVVKSRSRDPRALDYGRYMLVNTFSNSVVAGDLNSPRALTLEEVERWLER